MVQNGHTERGKDLRGSRLRAGGVEERWPEIRDHKDGKKKLEQEASVMGLTNGLDSAGVI